MKTSWVGSVFLQYLDIPEVFQYTLEGPEPVP